MKSKKIDDLVDSTINSMDEHRPLVVTPFLYTRILSRLHSPVRITIWERLYTLISQPAIAMTLLFFVVVVNSLIIFYNNKYDANNFVVETSTNELQSLTVSNNTAYYDIENIAP